MEIILKNLQKKIRLNLPQIQKAAKAILRHEGVRQATLSLVFVSRQRIQSLNKKYLKRSYATDVLAFDLAERRSPRKSLTGEIIISTDAVIRNAASFQTPPERETALYLIHGILHLLGYDDHHPADIKNMRAKEQELLAVLEKQVGNMIL